MQRLTEHSFEREQVERTFERANTRSGKLKSPGLARADQTRIAIYWNSSVFFF